MLDQCIKTQAQLTVSLGKTQEQEVTVKVTVFSEL